MVNKEKNDRPAHPICIAVGQAPIHDDFLDSLFGGMQGDKLTPESQIITENASEEQHKEEPASEPVPEPEREPEPERGPVRFGRKDANIEGERRADMEERDSEVEDLLTEGYLPPLPLDYTPNMEIALTDCVYSMFLGSIYEETATRKYDIFFMVAPFEIKENEPSSNIVLYVFYKNQNYALTSLNNREKNSLLCQIASFSFLVRGRFTGGVWDADVQLAGESLRREDVFEIKGVRHNNPKNMGATNGHIRFTYQGYINHPEIVSTGCVNVFPMDDYGEEFLIVRCLEDFVDIFYTDEVRGIEMHTVEGDKCLSVVNEDGIVTAKLD